MNTKRLLVGILSAGLMLGATGTSFAHPHPAHGHGGWHDSARDHRAYRPHRRAYRHYKKHHRHHHRPAPRYRSRIWYAPRHHDDHWGFTLFFRD